MAMNLRLSESAATALRAESERTGRSQQDIVREAVDRYLARSARVASAEPEDASATIRGSIRDMIIPPRTPYRHDIVPVEMPEGMTSLDLLDREDRF